MENNIVCPVSTERANENTVRVIAGIIFFFSIFLLKENYLVIVIFFVLDFAQRAFTKGDYSLLKFLAKNFVQPFSLSIRPIDAAPKKFAALIGFIFSIIITISLLIKWVYVTDISIIILIICSGLEAFAGYCVGCKVYTWIILPVKKLLNR